MAGGRRAGVEADGWRSHPRASPRLRPGYADGAQRAFLAQQGCRTYQGYLFSRPLAVAELETYLDAHRAPSA